MPNPLSMDGTKSTDDPGDSEVDPADSPSRDSQSDESPPDDQTEARITLSKQQLEDAGLQDLEPGDSFTVMLKGTVTDKGDANGVEADVDELMNGKIEGIIQAPLPNPMAIKGPKIKGPMEAGLMSGSPMLPDDVQ